MEVDCLLYLLQMADKSEKSHKCYTCGKVFSSASNMWRHKKTSHENVRSVCPLCTTTFTRKESLRAHLLAAHRLGGPEVEPAVEPVAEVVVDSVVEPVVEPVVAPVPDLVVEPVVESFLWLRLSFQLLWSWSCILPVPSATSRRSQ